MKTEGSFDVMRSLIAQALNNYRMRRMYREHNVAIGSHAEIANSKFEDFVRIAHHAQVSNSKIGLRTSVGRYAKINNAEIGKYCSISWDVTVGATKHPITHPSTHAFWYRSQFGLFGDGYGPDKPITIIENDVWIGCNSVVLPGVVIGNGAIVGASSVVTKDVAPYSIVAGSPARLVRMRFSDELISRLLDLRWWDWDDVEMKSHFEFFSTPLESLNTMIDGTEAK